MIPEWRSVRLYLNSEEETRSFAETFSRASARYVEEIGALAVFLIGDLGSGKTTFTRYAVRALPGGADAEVSSPSAIFTRPSRLCGIAICTGSDPMFRTKILKPLLTSGGRLSLSNGANG